MAILFINPIKQKVGKWNYFSKKLDIISVKKGESSFLCDPELFRDLDSVKIGKSIYKIEKIDEEKCECFLNTPVSEDFDGMAMYELSIPIKIKTANEKYDIMLDTDIALMDKTAYKTVKLSTISNKQRQLEYLKDIGERVGKADIDMATVDIITIDEVKNNASQLKSAYIKKLVELVINIDLSFRVDEDLTFFTVFNEYLKTVNPSLVLKSTDDYIGLAKALSNSEVGVLSEEEQELRLKLTIANIQNGRSPEEYEKDIDTAIMMDKFRKSFDSEEAFQEYVKNVQDSMKETAVVEEVVKPTKKRK